MMDIEVDDCDAVLCFSVGERRAVVRLPVVRLISEHPRGVERRGDHQHRNGHGDGAGHEALAAARSNMIATLNSFRDTLEDLGGGLGVTDPVAGPVVMALK